MHRFLAPKETLIIADGQKPDLSLLAYHRHHARKIIALDGACTWLSKNHIKPDLIIGDLDSMGTHHDPSIPVLHLEDQNSNDLEKAFHYCHSNKLNQISVLGAFGLRSDHFLTNLFVLKKFAPLLMISLIDDLQCSFMCPSKQMLHLTAMEGAFISYFPLADRVGPISSTGVEYPLTNEMLSLSSRIGTLNRVIDAHATLFSESDDLLVVIPNNGNRIP